MLYSAALSFLLFERIVSFTPTNRSEHVGNGRAATVIPTVDLGRGISNWPSLVVAPYTYTSPWNSFSWQRAQAATGCKYWSLAFLQSDSSGNPAWGGSDSIYNPWYSSYIGGIRANGGDVIVSFGGAGANEIAQNNWDVSTLAARYQSVIDLYQLTRIDLDIEGHAATDPASIDRRSQALAIIQARNPSLQISYTLATGTTGLDYTGLSIVQSALKFGVKLHTINLMTMDYGNYISRMGQAAISAAAGTYQQMQRLGLNCKIGITSMIGVNDTPGEVTYLSDAQEIVDWALKTPYIGIVSFWESGRDHGVWGPLYASSQITQYNYQFHQIFMAAQSRAVIAPSTIPDWNDCTSTNSKCTDSTFVCCHGNAADLSAGKNTCRPPNSCYTGVKAQATCSATDVCSDSAAKCCSGSAADYLAGVTKCLTSCYTPIAQWNNCNAGADVCATTSDTCCFGSANDITVGKTTCRPSSNCYIAPPPALAPIAPAPAPITPAPIAPPPAPIATTILAQKYTTTVPAPNPTPIQPDSNFLGGYNWKQKVFAAYVDITKTPLFDAVALSNTVGSARYLLGFVTSDANGNSVWGTTATGGLLYNDKITAMRGFGGDVGVSFGGPGGTELAAVAKTATALQNQYQNVIDGYSVTWIDFYLDTASASNQAATNLRNQVLRTMQILNPNIRLTYSLRVTPTGLTAESLYVLQSAARYGVRVDLVNILAFDYGAAAAPNAGLASGTYAIQAATYAYNQVTTTLGYKVDIGVTAMIGQSSIETEFFQPADASQLVKWAKTESFVSLLSFMSANRDQVGASGVTQTDNQFASIFVQYEN